MPSETETRMNERRIRGLTCQQVVELITAYLEGTLDDEERAEVADHLAVCANCSTYLDQMRQTAAWLSQLCGDGVDPAVKGELLSRFRRWRSGELS
jgi:anti-sigma factor RsiW